MRANTHAYCNGNADSDGDSDSDAYCYRGAEVYADAQAASHTGASYVVLVVASLCEAQT